MKGKVMTEQIYITLEKLKELERKEYEQLHELDELRTQYIKEKNDKLVDSVTHSITFQHGRWGMLVDLIEELEEENE